MKILKQLPNLITSCNVICGSVGIIFVFNNEFLYAMYMVWAGAFFDFFDGLAARLVNAQSEMGKELDSLADMVTFGALPGFFIYRLIDPEKSYLAYAGIFIIVFSALRLAKFNVDTRQSENFIGLPTPAHTLFITALPLLGQLPVFKVMLLPQSLAIAAIIGSLLLVSELPLLSLKVKNLSWQNNRFRYLLLVGSATTLLFFGPKSLSLVVILYIFISVLWNLIDKPVVK
ncbi:MAG: CDP-diacylglycerol--serine O-phosphatidyltransferase [Bacteroidota bacterium]